MAASVVVVTYNSSAFIRACLRSLQDQSFPAPFEIIVVDHASKDGTADLVRREFPEVRLLERPNAGFGAGCNRGAEAATGQVLAFVNPDTQAASDWLATLVAPVAQGQTVTTSRIMLLDEPQSVNTRGNAIHYTGIAFTRGFRRPPASTSGVEEVPGVSGAAFAIHREDFRRIGGFDEGFFLYLEDSDLSWMARRAGLRILCVDDSVVHHRYGVRLGADKLYYITFGRIRLLRKHYRWWDWILYAPGLLTTNLLLWSLALRHGWKGVKAKLRGSWHGWTRPLPAATDLPRIKPARATVPRMPIEEIMPSRLGRALSLLPNLVYRLNTLSWKRRPASAPAVQERSA